MNFPLPNFLPALPEIFLLTMACVVLLVDIFLSDRSRGATYILAMTSLLGMFVLVAISFSSASVTAFSDTFVRDPMADVLKMGIAIAAMVTFLYAKDYLREHGIFKGEFYILGLFGVLGMMILVSAHNFLTIYLGLELLSLCMYAMVAMQRDSANASEAAMKYFVLGAIASGMLLYGMSILYGVTGTLDLALVNERLPGVQDKILLSFGLVFLIVGIAFKLGAVPFHMWVPDVYEGSPTAVTLYLAAAPKLAAFAMLMRLLVDGMVSLQGQWQDILILLAIASMAIGNIVAISQDNLKRMLAYSAISHVGYLLLGVLTGTHDGYAASMFYALVYVLMTLGAFGMIMLMSRQGFESDRLEDFKGLNERSPWFAFIMMILMFSMAGVPPFLGFWAKLSVLKALVASTGLLWLALTAVVFSIIGAFYYLRVIKIMYFDKAEDSSALVAGSDIRVVLSANGLLVLGLGLAPNLLMAFCLATIITP